MTRQRGITSHLCISGKGSHCLLRRGIVLSLSGSSHRSRETINRIQKRFCLCHIVFHCLRVCGDQFYRFVAFVMQRIMILYGGWLITTIHSYETVADVLRNLTVEVSLGYSQRLHSKVSLQRMVNSPIGVPYCRRIIVRISAFAITSFPGDTFVGT
ncbi:hypothetical protein BD410DRAFT_165412 [Rickenella mellea]|uniref:Uncharacterized protein n=1 Tax=Rickenella mellea TaxID=50990 RepID=A0A4Y7Q896_9AGAM|nr:hypothetical protein BD410DRAFT_165412 [Rickenella mellea]